MGLDPTQNPLILSGFLPVFVCFSLFLQELTVHLFSFAADFFLFFFSVLQQRQFRKDSRNAAAAGPQEGPRIDFTKQPRNFLQSLKLYFFWTFFHFPFILTFVAGTSVVNILGFFYLVNALFFMSQGEDMLLKPSMRSRNWQLFRWYNYLWFVTLLAFQIPAKLNHIENQPDGTRLKLHLHLPPVFISLVCHLVNNNNLDIFNIFGLFTLYLNSHNAPSPLPEYAEVHDCLEYTPARFRHEKEKKNFSKIFSLTL